MLTSPLRALALSCAILLAACGDDPRHTSNNTGSLPTATAPDYWPTTEWRTATPDSHGFMAGALDGLADEAATALPYYTSLLVIKDGYVVHESYNNGSDASSQHHVWSVTKSVTSLTTGRAWTKGDIDNLDVTAAEAFDNSIIGHLPPGDARRNISLRHALQMRSGLAWNEGAWLGSRNPTLLAFLSPDCSTATDKTLCYLLHQPLAYAPGTVWNYSTYDPYIISGFFKAMTGTQLADYANDNLFSPLGIDSTHVSWPALSALGSTYTFGGGLLNIRSRDLAKLGMLVLYDGQWDGQQLIAKEWLDLTLAAQGPGQLAAFDDTTGEPIAAVDGDIRYGMQWWRASTPDMSGDDAITALGLYGQLMAINKEKGLIIILTSADGSEDEARDRYTEISQFITTHIVDKLAP